MDTARNTATLESKYIHIDGIRMHSCVSIAPADAGDSVIVLVHGLGVASYSMTPLVERLAHRYSVYAPDLPGFGKSSKPSQALNVSEMADVLADWMRLVGLGRVVLLGNSFGCQIAAACAARHPERVKRMVLVGPVVDPKARTFRLQTARWFRNSRLEPPSQGMGAARAYWALGIRRMSRTVQYVFEDRIEACLPYVHIPTLVVRGSLDPIVPQRWAEEATQLLPKGRLTVVPGAAHGVAYNAPDEMASAVLQFLSEGR